MSWKTGRTMPLPEPADATFTVLLQKSDSDRGTAATGVGTIDRPSHRRRA